MGSPLHLHPFPTRRSSDLDELEQHHVACEASLQLLVAHRVAAELHHDGLAVEALDVGQRLGQDARLLRGLRAVVERGVHPVGILQNKRAGVLPAPGAVLREELLDSDPLLRGCLLLRQRQLEHAVVVPGLGLRLVQFLRQREAARNLAERALGVEHALVLRDFLLPLDISGQRYLRAVDGDLDVFLRDARDLGGDNVGAVFLRHVDFHAGQLGAPFHREGTHQKALEQVIDQLVERIESGNASHLLSPFLKLRTLHVGAAQPVSRPLESLAMSDFRTRVEGERPYLLRYAALQLRTRHTAEDVVQETLLAALAGETSFGGRSNLRTWLTGILKHKIVDAIRRASREAPTADEDQMEELFDQTGHWREMPSAWADPDAALEQKEFFVKLEIGRASCRERV